MTELRRLRHEERDPAKGVEGRRDADVVESGGERRVLGREQPGEALDARRDAEGGVVEVGAKVISHLGHERGEAEEGVRLSR